MGQSLSQRSAGSLDRERLGALVAAVVAADPDARCAAQHGFQVRGLLRDDAHVRHHKQCAQVDLRSMRALLNSRHNTPTMRARQCQLHDTFVSTIYHGRKAGGAPAYCCDSSH